MNEDPWPTPFGYTVQGGLRPLMSQQSDGKTTILRPKQSSEFIEGQASPVIPDLCRTPSVESIAISPASGPYHVNDAVDLSPFNVQGTGPFTYAWTIGDGVTFTTENITGYVIRLVDTFPIDGVRHFFGGVVITGQCGHASADFDITITP